MLKINQLADYALFILSQMNQERFLSSKELSEKTKIPLPTTNKILKILKKNHLCITNEGKFGGFALNFPLDEITLFDVVSSFDKKLQITKCNHNCSLEKHCQISDKMKKIDQEIQTFLKNKYLNELL
jgi:Rrf2 family protein